MRKKNQFVKTIQQQLIERYGGEEHLNSIPRELVVEAQTEQYVEYNRFGKVVKGDQRATIKSKYVEDVYENEHTSVWGSYWHNHRWGYACCHSLLRQSYCTGVIVEEKEIEFETNDIPNDDNDQDKPKSLVEMHREKLNKQKVQPKSSSSNDDKNSTMKKLDKKKVQEAAREIAEREKRAEEMLNVDERKRKYNSLKSDINQQEPTEEELEAYRLKKHRHDDPMAKFMLNS